MAPSRRERPDKANPMQLLERGTFDHYHDTALYDFEYADRVEDIEWYRKLAREHAGEHEILELGAGTGRITCPLAADGHVVLALDHMEAMLDALRSKAAKTDWGERIRPLKADMLTLPVPDASVGMVIAPFNALMHLYRWEDLLACFREVARVLRPGGVFGFDVELPDLEWLTWDPNKRHAVTRFVHPTTGERLVYSTNHSYDAKTQVCHIRIYYDDAPRPGRRFMPPKTPRKLVHLAHRQIFPEELRMLVSMAGLALESLTGDFEGVSLGPAIQSQVAVCVR